MQAGPQPGWGSRTAWYRCPGGSTVLSTEKIGGGGNRRSHPGKVTFRRSRRKPWATAGTMSCKREKALMLLYCSMYAERRSAFEFTVGGFENGGHVRRVADA